MHARPRSDPWVHPPSLQVNYTIMLLCIAVVAGFKDTVALGNAYGRCQECT